MRKYFVAVLAGCAFSSGAARAAEPFVIDPAHTHVMFKVQRFGLSNTIGSFIDVAGTVMLDREAPEKSSVEATIKIASLSSGNALREDHVRGENWLNAAQFPIMTFKSNKVELTGEKTATVTGDLTLHGATKSVALDVTLNNIAADPVSKREAAGFTAKSKVNRHDFGVSIAEGLVGADVEIFIETLTIAPE